MKSWLRAMTVLTVFGFAFGALATSAIPVTSHAAAVSTYDPGNAGDGGTDGNGQDGAGSLPVPPPSPKPAS